MMLSQTALIGRDERGTSIVELALVAPFLAAMVVGMADVSRAYSTKLQLEQAAQRTIERVMQRETPTTNFTTALKTEGAAAASVAESAVIPDSWLECNGTRQAATVVACSQGQTYARYVTVDISKSYTPLFSVHFSGLTNGSKTLHGRAGIRIQ